MIKSRGYSKFQIHVHVLDRFHLRWLKIKGMFTVYRFSYLDTAIFEPSKMELIQVSWKLKVQVL